MLIVDVVCCFHNLYSMKYGDLLNSDSCYDSCVFEIKTVIQSPNRDSCLFMFTENKKQLDRSRCECKISRVY